MRNWNLRFNYGITRNEWNELFRKQNKCCKICKRKRPIGRGWATDHKGKKIRGILCNYCNTALGSFQESIKILKIAIKYLRENQ